MAAVLGLGVLALVVFLTRANRSPKLSDHAMAPPPPSVAGQCGSPCQPRRTIPKPNNSILEAGITGISGTPEDLSKALDYFTQAVVRDPNYAQAYVGLGGLLQPGMREYTLMLSSEAHLARPWQRPRKLWSSTINPPEAHASLAFVSFFGMWDIATGEREFRRAIDLNPKSASSHQWYANALLALHRFPGSFTGD